MILVGQYDSPYVRRVAISLRVLGFEYQHDTRSIFGDFDALRQINPVGRIPSLLLDDGRVLVDSAAILDWLDDTVGPERALLPPRGKERQRTMQLVVLATGVIDKVGAMIYERVVRPKAYRWPEWIERSRTQAVGGLSALAREPWPATDKLDQAQITTACMLRHAALSEASLLAGDEFACLRALSERCEARPEFGATFPAEYVLPAGD